MVPEEIFFDWLVEKNVYQSHIFSEQVYSTPLYSSSALFVNDISKIAHTFWIALLYSLNFNYLSPYPSSRTIWTRGR